MKVKCDPDDFRVEERTRVIPGSAGDFAFYRLSKRGWTTPDALEMIRRRWQLDWRRVAYGGLKDRHAHTTQFLTVYRGPRRNLSQPGVEFTYLGQIPRPYSPADIAANHFAVTLRDLSDAEADAAKAALSDVERTGLPNYFDDQRFGSVGPGREFVAREMVFGRFENALRLALAAPYAFDRAEQKREKETLLRHWGDWPACKQQLPKGHARSLVTYLADHPTDFRGAVARLRPELRTLYLSAYQSGLWNRMLSRWLGEWVPPADRLGVELRTGPVVFPRAVGPDLSATLNDLRLPLPSARLKFDPGAPWADVVSAVMAEEGLPLEQMKIRGMREPFFSKGERAAWVRPAGLAGEFAADDRHPGRQKLTLTFELPRGSYATILVKRLAAGSTSSKG